jgi:hypothetical protein
MVISLGGRAAVRARRQEHEAVLERLLGRAFEVARVRW